MNDGSRRQGLRISTLEGVSATIHGTLTTGAFLTGFALFLGASDLQLALISALPLLAQVFQIPGAWLAVRAYRRKTLVACATVFGRSLWLPIALLPILASHRSMGWFLALYGVSAVAMNVASPAWMSWNLGWSFKGMAVLGMISAGVSLVLNPWWGRALDRFGHRPVLIVSAFGILHVPLYYAFCPPDMVWPIYLNALMAGLFWSGFNLAMFSLLMHDLPMVGKPFYFALAAALSGVVNFLASLCGGWLAHHMGATTVSLFGIPMGNYQLLFLLTSAMRVPGLFLLRRIHEPGAKSSMVMVRQAFIEINRRVGLGRQIFLLPNGRKHRREGST